ncbi:hypothetical protein [Streptomyces sp. Je 1-369]|uniref:hypothetical protein n=1 Tax=Streptomyces sp. Je 1-369 TaxID=2966192 RepID=UPI002286053E|nr:hypothetical protein [Streptomyces sp. Je 1-369]WAL98916.1 hypothetical protein NOO62_33225 [Streptomyces sp. Je 1-369]
MRDGGHHEGRGEGRDDGVREKLRGAARAHRPDRERMLARIERGMAEGERSEGRSKATRRAGGASWLRVLSTTAAVAGVFAVVGYGLAVVLRDGESPQSVATSTSSGPPTVSPEPTGTLAPPTRRPSGPPVRSPGADEDGEPSGSSSREPSGGTGSSPKSSGRPADTDGSSDPAASVKSVPPDRLLWADGSIDPGSSAYWSQSDITVKAKKPLTALTVEVRVAGSGKVDDTGNWRSLPEGDFDASVTERDGGLVYRWTLKRGRTVPVGEHVFAGQFNHPAGKRDAGDDSYEVRAGTADERTVWRGDFA